MPQLNDHTITFEPQLTDDEFYELCRRFDDLNFEVTKEGKILMMTPAGNESSDANSEINTQLRTWWKTHRRGRVFDSNTLFILPDGSKMGPDAAYITQERLATVDLKKQAFSEVCPNFVIELLSASDVKAETIKKMHRWIQNGVELGWLIDPYQKMTHEFTQRGPRDEYIYRHDMSGLILYGRGPFESFQLDLAEVWEAYE